LKQLKKIYGEYLKKVGKLDEDIRLGKSKTRDAEDKAVITQQNQLLTERLKNRFITNDRIIAIAILMLCVIFGIGVFLVFYYRHTPSAMGGVFGGTFLSLLAIIRWLFKLWREKSYMDITLGILEGLTPRQAAEFISNIYWKLRGSS
jgi:hypothetical protein